MSRKVFEISPVLWIITLFFLGRVLGQGLVYFLEVIWLPPLKHWYSGLLAYEYLLPAQCGILLLMFRINIDVMRQRGFFHLKNLTLMRSTKTRLHGALSNWHY